MLSRRGIVRHILRGGFIIVRKTNVRKYLTVVARPKDLKQKMNAKNVSVVKAIVILSTFLDIILQSVHN